MFDPNKPYVTTGVGNVTLWMQDGICYWPATKEEVDPATLVVRKAPPVALPPTPPKEPAYVCKFCGVSRDTLDVFKEHLIAKHPDEVDMEKLSPKPEAPPTVPATDSSEGKKAKSRKK
ncbi:MAG TPA: hypothetical protein VMW24_12935 [Sedimentisphaerales bacterium]|nr:hypothetical protein [Sedimentisphaerales bacterium]